MLMKFGQCHFIKEKNLSKNSQNLHLETSSRPFVFAKNQAQPLLQNETFEGSYLYQICISKTIKICPNQHTELLRFFFTENFLKIKKGLRTSLHAILLI